ncbi:hypothetical protein F7C95_14630 [Opitutia bacterium ISCC 51]|nr:hypothetical protein F7C95_14630 [Opitutae bacterium ISCC 51]QXD27230.1 hypothetical protein GA003_14540 [Opitutae bacterium ISCC 52]
MNRNPVPSSDKKRSSGRKILLVLLAALWIVGGYFFLYLVIGGAFRSVAHESQRKAIQCNFRQIVSAADQYFLDNGLTEVHVEDLVGEDKYIQVVESVAGESYDGLVIRLGKELTVEDERGEIHRFQN